MRWPALILLLLVLLSFPGCGQPTPADAESDEGRIILRGAPGDEPDPPRPEVTIDYDARRVMRRDRWSTPLEGYLGLVRPPHVLHDAERAYVTHGDGVTALDMATGQVLWHEAGPNDRMCLSGDLLLAAECGRSDSIVTRGRWLVARRVTDGIDVFRVELPREDFDPNAIQEVAGLFLVQLSERPAGEGNGLLVDREGRVRHRFDRQVVTGKRLGEDRVFLTSRDIVRVSPDDQVLWAVPFHHREWLAGGDLVDLPDGHLLAFLHCWIADSGVQVIRLDPATGTKVWQAQCSPLGTTHSAYHHRATLALEGDRVKVTSRGSHGTFIEFLDLRTGQKLKPPAP